jgi:TRAP-type C4-dicarboxylate transport system substrate-binding protein
MRKLFWTNAMKVFALTLLLCVMTADAAAAAPAKILKQANSSPDDAPMPLALQKMAEALEKKSNGTLKMEIFSNSQLGTARECLESLQSGVIDITARPSRLWEGLLTLG